MSSMWSGNFTFAMRRCVTTIACMCGSSVVGTIHGTWYFPAANVRVQALVVQSVSAFDC